MTKTATAEEVWATIDALGKSQQRTEEALRESQRRGEEARRKGEQALRESHRRAEEARREGEKALRESHLQTQKEMQQTQKEVQQTQKEVQQTQKEVRELNQSLKEGGGNFNNKWGHFLENLLEDDLVKLLNQQNIKVEEVYPRLVVKKSGVVTGEYDIVAVNGEEVVVFEVKTTLEKDHVGHFLKKLAAFKSRVSVYKDKTIYGGIAYMSLKNPEKDKSKDFPQYENAFEMAQENGLFLIQSPGGAKDVSKIVNKEGVKPKVF